MAEFPNLKERNLYHKVIFTKDSLFIAQAPCWNFELNADKLLAKALELGFVSKIGDDQYLMNNNYEGKNNG